MILRLVDSECKGIEEKTSKWEADLVLDFPVLHLQINPESKITRRSPPQLLKDRIETNISIRFVVFQLLFLAVNGEVAIKFPVFQLQNIPRKEIKSLDC